MSNKHTKLKKKPTIEQFMRAQITRIKAVVPGMNVTIVAGIPWIRMQRSFSATTIWMA